MGLTHQSFYLLVWFVQTRCFVEACEGQEGGKCEVLKSPHGFPFPDSPGWPVP
jgi:hypothetical protein